MLVIHLIVVLLWDVHRSFRTTSYWVLKRTPPETIWKCLKIYSCINDQRYNGICIIMIHSIYHFSLQYIPRNIHTVFFVLCFVVVMQSFIMNSHEVFIHIHQGCFAGTGAIVRLPQCQWSKPDGYGKISQCITTTKHSKAKTVCIFLGIYCSWLNSDYTSHNDIFQWYKIPPPSIRQTL